MNSYQTTDPGVLHVFIANFESSRTDQLEEYRNIIQDQLSSGILEYGPDKPEGKRVF